MQPLLDAVLDYLPSPLDVPPVEGLEPVKGEDEGKATRQASDDEPFAALAFKVMSDPFVGKLTYFRVYSGKLEAGGRVLNAATGRTERVGRILMMHANDREEQTEVYAGDIAAGVGLKQTSTGNTLCAPDADHARDDRVPTTVTPRSSRRRRSTRRRCDRRRQRLAEDPLQVRTDAETGQRSCPAWASSTSRSSSTADAASKVERPSAAAGGLRRETVRGRPRRSRAFVRQTGGSGQYGGLHRPRAGSRRGLRLRQQDQGRLRPSEFIPLSRRASRRRSRRASRPATRWSTSARR